MSGEKIISEGDLLKSLQELSGKITPPAADDGPAKIETTSLAKTADTVGKNGSHELKKTLEVSSALSEFTTLLGEHVDNALSTMQKSVASAAERDLNTVRILTGLAKSVDGLKEQVEALAKSPAAQPKTDGKTTTEDLAKKAGAESGDKEIDQVALRKSVTASLETLAKNAEQGSPAQTRYVNAISRFESGGGLPEDILAEVHAAHGKK